MSIRLRNDLAEIQRMHDAVTAFAGRCRLPEEVRLALDLSLEEVLVNVISYGFPDPGSHEIEVIIRVDGKRLTAEVQDDGLAFNPLEHPEPETAKPIDERPVGGLGIHLIRQLMERIEYHRRGEKNVLVMDKSWDRP
ncbi:MAG: ATP-binding protein [Acidobacteria bacterium]|nr:ATP-binding protein [Acidobacteriota bacterium]